MVSSTPQLPSVIPETPTIRGHQGSLSGYFLEVPAYSGSVRGFRAWGLGCQGFRV